MDVSSINRALLHGATTEPGVLPHLEELAQASFVFRLSFGLDRLPENPGVILIRGARQYGKSTWLEKQIQDTITTFGPGTAYYLNGDEIPDAQTLITEIRTLVPLYSPRSPIKRLFIDEITAIPHWEKALKRLIDAGELRSILVITTGSKAIDLRRGTERLPGRKGKLERTTYLFTPISYKEFQRVCGSQLQSHTLPAYLISGGCPIACAALATERRIPEYVTTMVRDWILGECAAQGRLRSSLLNVLKTVGRYGGSCISQSKLARETGLANNTVAAGYIEMLRDLLVLIPAHVWDPSREIALYRKPSKLHFVNTFAASAYHVAKISSITDFLNLSLADRAIWYEWIVAQELWRRLAVTEVDIPDSLVFWQSRDHEIDFVISENQFLEVKLGSASPLDFSWFHQCFPKGKLTVINTERFETSYIQGITLEDFLLEVE